VRYGLGIYMPRSAHTVYLCVLCGSQNKQRLFPYTALTDWFLQPRWSVYCAVRTESFNIIEVNIIITKTVLWLWRLVACPTDRGPGFDPKPLYVTFVADNVHSDGFPSQYFSFPLSGSFHKCPLLISSYTLVLPEGQTGEI
jgi:hypothetical protein